MLANHVIVCGLGRIGRRVLHYLQAAGVTVVAIDHRLTPEEIAATGSVRYIAGDFRQRDVLDRAGLANSRGLFILTSEDLVNLSALMVVAHARPDLRVVVRMFNPTLVSRLGTVAQNVFALSTSALTAPMLAHFANAGEALASFELDDAQAIRVAEWTLPAGHDLVGRRLDDLGVGVLALARPGEPNRFFADLAPETTLAAGDQLVLCGPADAVRARTEKVETDLVLPRRWTDAVRRFGRMMRKVFVEVDLPVKICTAVLLIVIATSVLVFKFGMRNDTLVDAFYRTISLMATGADMRGQDVDPGSWQKAFISGLRLVGAALTAAFTAILTNYLVRAQLGGALEVRRIPDRGHVIITGLGNVSFRALEELRRRGEEVVAIERNRDNTFIATSRKLGAAVILGDALVDAVLKQAHAEGAKAVLVATDDELANLEIALLVRELHPKKRLLVRLIDPQLAELLREAANIHLALSIPELAAPVFLAAFYGDTIRHVLLVNGQLVAAIDIRVHATDALVDRPVSDWAHRYRLLPLSVSVAGQKRDLTAPIVVGSVLNALVTFRDVHGLLQRSGN